MSSTTIGNWSQQGGVDEVGDPFYCYYNALIVNNRTTVGQARPNPKVEFVETRQTPLIKNASKYDFSIIRANLNGPGKDLPIFIPVIATGNDNVEQNINKTIYTVSLQLTVDYIINGNDFNATFTTTQNCIWTPEILDPTLAITPLVETTQTNQDVDTRYYWCLTFSHWVKIVNTAFQACVDDLQTQFNANWVNVWNQVAPAPTLQTSAPILIFNPTTELFSIYADRVSFGGDDRTSKGSNTDESCRLFFNTNTYNLISNFQTLFPNLPNGLTYEILIYQILYSNILALPSPPAPTAKSYWIMNQDYPSISSVWSPIESIVFTSTLLPISKEGVSAPIEFGESTTGSVENTEANFNPIITDISLTTASASDYRQFIQFIPSAEYRMTSFLSSNIPVSNIDIQIFWKNRLNGRLYPLLLTNQSSVSVKIMFRKRLL